MFQADADMGATSHMWLLGTCNVASVAEKCLLKLYFGLINSNVKRACGEELLQGKDFSSCLHRAMC